MTPQDWGEEIRGLRGDVTNGFARVHARLDEIGEAVTGVRIASASDRKEVENVARTCLAHLKRTTDVEQGHAETGKTLAWWRGAIRVVAALTGGAWAVILLYIAAYLAGWRP